VNSLGRAVALTKLKVSIEVSARTTILGQTGGSARAAMVAMAMSTLALTGCGARNPFLSYGPSPRSEDCAQIQQATPTKYVCGGKVYTSVQLTAIRNGAQNP
jgi:hypothetical protein